MTAASRLQRDAPARASTADASLCKRAPVQARVLDGLSRKKNVVSRGRHDILCLLCLRLFRVICHSGLSDHADLDLARVFHFPFDLLGNVSRQQDHIRICDLLRNYHYTNLTARLNGIRITDPFKAAGDLFQLIQSRCIVSSVSRLAPGLAADIASAA